MWWTKLPPVLSKTYTFPHRQTCTKIHTLGYEVGQATEVSMDGGTGDGQTDTEFL